jgi:predicted DNA-binding protein (MmcQ/YjbR family)
MDNMDRLEQIAFALPEAERVDIEQWGGHPTFRVRGKNFVFCDIDAHHLSLKLTHDEAAAVVATDPDVSPAGYGLGRHGWIALTVAPNAAEDRWRQITEWVQTSYRLVAPKSLVRISAERDNGD